MSWRITKQLSSDLFSGSGDWWLLFLWLWSSIRSILLPKNSQYTDNSLKTNPSSFNDCNLSDKFRFHAIGPSDLVFLKAFSTVTANYNSVHYLQVQTVQTSLSESPVMTSPSQRIQIISTDSSVASPQRIQVKPHWFSNYYIFWFLILLSLRFI